MLRTWLITLVATAGSLCSFSQGNVIPLYPAAVPGARPAANQETAEDASGVVSKVSVPTLGIFLAPAEKSNGTAVVICPGGGYWVLSMKDEGRDVARKFNELGVSAFVLKYRIPDDHTMISKETAPLMDAEQAIKVVRDRAAEWRINPHRIGIMGFSAGGHVASTEGTQYMRELISNPEKTSLRPDFMMLIYPVISFQDDIGHIGSRNQLLGPDPSQEKKDEYSGELHVTADTPPSFLVHASDDKGVKVENTIRFYLALRMHQVGAEMHIYERGGHGFGLKIPGSNARWMDDCANWLQSNGWLGSSSKWDL